jgi:hypothetical protein
MSKSKIAKAIDKIANHLFMLELNKASSVNKYEDFLDKMSKHLLVIKEFMQCTELQATFIVVLYYYNSNDRGNYLLQELMELIPFSIGGKSSAQKVISSLISRGIVNEIAETKFRGNGVIEFKYALSEAAIAGIESDKQIKGNELIIKMNDLQVVERLVEGDSESNFDNKPYAKKIDLYKRQLSALKHHPFVMDLNAYRLSEDASFLLVCFIWQSLEQTELNLESFLSRTFKSKSRFYEELYKFHSKTHILIQGGFLNVYPAAYQEEVSLVSAGPQIGKLVERFNFILRINENASPYFQIISPEKINPAELYYDADLNERMEFLTEMLEDQKLREIQNNMTQNGFAQGISVFLYGSPGTGKTESVYQIARKTGRAVFKVNIGSDRSMWFGESEKMVNNIFNAYEDLSKRYEVKPVLLFNEADAIFNKRMDNSKGNVRQTEHRIQNILLEQLECFNGILVATSNLASALDAAFERRFLFKIKFNAPKMQTAALIWKHNLPNLTKVETERLATAYNFSGGQINNIVRKVTIHKLLHGIEPDFVLIEAFCNDEHFIDDRKFIGYERRSA